MRRPIATLLVALTTSGCFGAVSTSRSYYVLGSDPATRPPEPSIKGTVRVQNLDADAAYEKFQLVVRKNPYELHYSDLHVWAVKPNQMISDIIARTLLETGAFEDVFRNLGDRKPTFTLGGDLNAVEIYDSDDLWYAHLALSLRLTRFEDGAQLWQMSYDQRKLVATRTHAQAVRALSELLSAAVRQAYIELRAKGLEVYDGEAAPIIREPAQPSSDQDTVDPDEPIFVPEAVPQ